MLESAGPSTEVRGCVMNIIKLSNCVAIVSLESWKIIRLCRQLNRWIQRFVLLIESFTVS